MVRLKTSDRDEQTRLRALYDSLRRMRPEGWSVVYGENGIVVRPADRSIGKFSITSTDDRRYYVSLFCRRLNIWSSHTYCDDRPGAAEEIRGWMVVRMQEEC